jgi:hypothetical protein
MAEEDIQMTTAPVEGKTATETAVAEPVVENAGGGGEGMVDAAEDTDKMSKAARQGELYSFNI